MAEDARRMKRSKVHPSHKTRFKIANWRAYERGLVGRGSLTFHFSPDLLRSWKPRKTGKRGAPRRYSDAVMELALFGVAALWLRP